MQELTTFDCEQVSGGLVLAIIGVAAICAGVAGAIYLGYKMESAGDECK